ncbi:hypothetical protein [Nocardioides perillae]|uniref:Uncharacterized protein n=1 Tax=Nocardioides perillae TaxID=1119534 RepID=A0A7Y9RWI3_9ACTN|nr:hypothetical protein [Nocardioides perillae]NYG55952.1 hypothetical protein [Nocardioides perillae]
MIIATGLVSACGQGGVDEGNRLRTPSAHGWAIAVEPGAPFTDGFEVLQLVGDGAVTITDVDLVGADGLRVVGARVAGDERRFASIQFMSSFPPSRARDRRELGTLLPAVGATLDPTENENGWELLIGIEADEDGVFVRDGIRVEYVSGGETYQQTFPAALTVCVRAVVERAADCDGE